MSHNGPVSSPASSSTQNTCEPAAICTRQTRGSTVLPMFGLTFDGDVDNNDLLNLGLHCF